MKGRYFMARSGSLFHLSDIRRGYDTQVCAVSDSLRNAVGMAAEVPGYFFAVPFTIIFSSQLQKELNLRSRFVAQILLSTLYCMLRVTHFTRVFLYLC